MACFLMPRWLRSLRGRSSPERLTQHTELPVPPLTKRTNPVSLQRFRRRLGQVLSFALFATSLVGHANVRFFSFPTLFFAPFGPALPAFYHYLYIASAHTPPSLTRTVHIVGQTIRLVPATLDDTY